ncbi:MAG: hypothetical protein AUJ20_08795 [Comamonadaceae bacterium CG1_02_60_18]|nr:MAG: hypothetical protein AUJ20_08795 [Comamonadaceae bacterium CG1_02_60_18]PIQ51590.1 MAG: hypothetical protein COW02_14165 [Comamonadaceae bacterium CG12_big_fil_rev_8_21_14_0_65_59_15]
MHDDFNLRLTTSLEALSARIARLAIGLGVDMDNAQAFDAILSQPTAAFVPEERRNSVAGTVAVPTPSVDRRVAHLKEELRALVVLRYHLERTSIENGGLQVTREMLEQAHKHLLAQGFKPGADGWHTKDWQPLG